jgi:thermostable 8-oxoguanine DNA glycosylase
MNKQQTAVEKLANYYMDAKLFVVAAGYSSEIDWQEQRKITNIDESDFLREAAWVVLSSGMRETIIRQRFSSISEAFFEWESADKIVRQKKRCIENSFQHFKHLPKLNAIVNIAVHVLENGFDRVMESIKHSGLDYIMGFPYMGPATSCHFAKNIGLSLAKPDRHLLRITQKMGYSSPQELCNTIAERTGDKISVVDLVLWRFATMVPNYLSKFGNTIIS